MKNASTFMTDMNRMLVAGFLSVQPEKQGKQYIGLPLLAPVCVCTIIGRWHLRTNLMKRSQFHFKQATAWFGLVTGWSIGTCECMLTIMIISHLHQYLHILHAKPMLHYLVQTCFQPSRLPHTACAGNRCGVRFASGSVDPACQT